MSDEIQRILWALDGRYGYLIAFTAWITVIRFVMQFFRKMLHDYLATVAAENDKAWINKLLENRWYKFLSFLVDYIASTKLPSAVTVSNIKGDTTIIQKP